MIRPLSRLGWPGIFQRRGTPIGSTPTVEVASRQYESEIARRERQIKAGVIRETPPFTPRPANPVRPFKWLN